MQHKRLVIIIITSVIILFGPLIAMQFTEEVNWTLSDFIIAGILLIGTGLICEFTLRKIKKTKYRITIILAIFVVLLLIWAELAVGIFGSPFNGS
tara:strand:- start:5679 stop:5963 length:285 start_codon:yes stop_codon:yes gene_type:complete